MLTQADIKALRKADEICFDFLDGKHQIRAIKRREHTADGFDNAVYIECSGYISNYGNRECSNGNWQEIPIRKCFYMEHSASFSPRWRTVAGHLRAGDSLILRWTAGDSSEVLRQAGLVHDSLILEVYREEKGKDNKARVKRFQYHMGDRVAPSTSTARMCS